MTRDEELKEQIEHAIARIAKGFATVHLFCPGRILNVTSGVGADLTLYTSKFSQTLILATAEELSNDPYVDDIERRAIDLFEHFMAFVAEEYSR